MSTFAKSSPLDQYKQVNALFANENKRLYGELKSIKELNNQLANELAFANKNYGDLLSRYNELSERYKNCLLETINTLRDRQMS